MKTIATLTAALAILATPTLAGQKAGPNLPLLQALPQMTAAAKPKPKRTAGKSQQQYMIIRLNEVLISNY